MYIKVTHMQKYYLGVYLNLQFLVLGTNEEFTPYAPIIEQVKLTNQELKEVLKLEILHEKNIDQELKLLEQYSKASNYRPETND